MVRLDAVVGATSIGGRLTIEELADGERALIHEAGETSSWYRLYRWSDGAEQLLPPGDLAQASAHFVVMTVRGESSQAEVTVAAMPF